MLSRFHAPSLTECFICGNIVDIGDPVVFDATWPKGRTTAHEHCFDNWSERPLPSFDEVITNIPRNK